MTRVKKVIRAFSLIEILVAISIFVLIVSSVSSFALDAVRAARNTSQRNTSMLELQEMYNALVFDKNNLWSTIVDNSDGTPKYLTFSNNAYQIVNGTTSQNGSTLSFTIGNVQRDVNGNIVQSGGTVDAHTRAVTFTAAWTDSLAQNQSVSSALYINDWQTQMWTQTTQANFDAGTYNETVSQSAVDGEVVLDKLFYPDWCRPTLAINQYDLPGSATSRAVFANPGHAYLGTAGSSGGVALTKLNITGVTPPVITVEGTFNGYTVNNIFVNGNYAYLATTNTSKEVVILDVSHTPYTEIGYFNATGSAKAYSVFVSGTVGYVATGQKVQTFNLTSNTGSRAKYGEITLSLNQNPGTTSYVAQIKVNGSYLYAALNNDWYEMAIANVTNPASMSLTSQTNVNNQQTFDLQISSDGNRAYFGTNHASGEDDFWIVDTSGKTGDRPKIGSYNTSGMDILGVAIIEADHRAILVGNNGQQYQAVDITNEALPTKCGGMNMTYQVYDVDSVNDLAGNAFSYIVTADPNHEFQILRGGPGGGGVGGYAYFASGDYTSAVFDSTSATTRYFYLDWHGQLPANDTIKLQIRAGATSDLSSATWIGPDGTGATYFTSQSSTSLPAIVQNKRYIQFKAFFTSDTVDTGVLNDVSINYQK